MSAKVLDDNGVLSIKDVTPEELYLLQEHTVRNGLAADNARAKYEEQLKNDIGQQPTAGQIREGRKR